MEIHEIEALVREATKKIEGALERKFGATGRGVNEKADSVADVLGPALIKRIRFVASIRNKLNHEQDFTGRNVPLPEFMRARDHILQKLETIPAGGERRTSAGGLDEDEEKVSDEPPQDFPRAKARGSELGFNLLMLAPLALVGGIIWFLQIVRSSERHSAAAASVAAATVETSPSASTAPLWSTEHARHAAQAFPWREEQAQFIRGAEKGTLPAETLWVVTSSARPVGKPVRYLELDVQLGGGTTTGTLRFDIDDFAHSLSVKPFPRTMVVPGKLTAKQEVNALAMDAAGLPFPSGTPLFRCEREVSGGCSNWLGAGVTYVAVSIVSFDNALKLAYERAP